MNVLTDKINIFLRNFSKNAKTGQDALFQGNEIGALYENFTLYLHLLDKYCRLCHSMCIKVISLMHMETEYR